MIGTLIAAVMAGIFLGVGAWIFRSVKARRQWPTTPGTITGADVRQKTSGVGDDESTVFVPVVEYRYVARDSDRVGSGIGFGEVGYGSRRMAEKKLARYPVGSSVTVHYNPQKPAETFLEPGGGVVAWIMLGSGIVLLVLTVVLGINGV